MAHVFVTPVISASPLDLYLLNICKTGSNASSKSKITGIITHPVLKVCMDISDVLVALSHPVSWMMRCSKLRT